MKTRQSLLQRAKEDAQSEAWFTLLNIYEPLIAGWVFKIGIEMSDVADLTQDVLLFVAKELPKFEHNGQTGAFRSWLRQIAVNRCRRHWDSKARKLKFQQIDNDGANLLEQLEDKDSELCKQWDLEHDQFVLKRVLEKTASEFEPEDYSVFSRIAVDGESSPAVAEELGISVGRIYKIKHKVMKRLREVAQGLVDDIKFHPDSSR